MIAHEIEEGERVVAENKIYLILSLCVPFSL